MEKSRRSRMTEDGSAIGAPLTAGGGAASFSERRVVPKKKTTRTTTTVTHDRYGASSGTAAASLRGVEEAAALVGRSPGAPQAA